MRLYTRILCAKTTVVIVSLSLDGQVASGSADFTIRTFDPQIGAPMGKLFWGHSRTLQLVHNGIENSIFVADKKPIGNAVARTYGWGPL